MPIWENGSLLFLLYPAQAHQRANYPDDTFGHFAEVIAVEVQVAISPAAANRGC